MKHTPGPWIVHGQVKYIIKSGTYEIGNAAEPHWVAQVLTLGNARIIAAAPDMLDALKAYELLDEKHSNCEDCEGNGEPEACGECFPFADDARLKMRAAIAKAEGREEAQRAATPVQRETKETP